ncbi:hypothetical protein BU23DRAFT_49919 [Bimuria novae-zelandiae CBS 107.79]|uniref:Uncharacterized protein n=1 Tax=Bimuria novae-zelandiae CBS 107.79 TaxID=1447943 RepID=A0A6A5UJG5_9PLEO|nr:hypothetical protein BU23DRAFT_49919 [Bimuria novae-zelandiae CBS 107.79]
MCTWQRAPFSMSWYVYLPMLAVRSRVGPTVAREVRKWHQSSCRRSGLQDVDSLAWRVSLRQIGTSFFLQDESLDIAASIC